MTISQAAKKYKVSRQAIYNRLEKKGIPLDDIRDPSTGVLTSDGEVTLDELFCKHDEVSSVNRLTKADATALQEENQRLKDRVAELEKDKSFLAEQLRAAQTNIESLQKSLDQAQKLQDQEQQLHAVAQQQLKLLSDPNQKKKHWWSRG